MESYEIRKKFLEYFQDRDHKVIPSASLVPEDALETDKTLFTSAGMQRLKNFYLSPDEAPAPRIATCQKCIRTGDIDEVGDGTHLTFFEMLGNFSFGYPKKDNSYFKEEAIKMAWNFLTEILRVDRKRIYATYFDSKKSHNNKDVATDTESKNLLEKIDGLSKIISQGDENFWSLGSENSPGGPTVEFYIDGIEIWNLVFNEYIFKKGKYQPAEFKGVDTGMGLERLITVLNDLDNVYETDLFLPVIRKIEETSGKKYDASCHPEESKGVKGSQEKFRIIADHIKAAAFAVYDGIEPSNKGSGYVVRRLLRRAIVKAFQLGIEKNIACDLVAENMFIYNHDIDFVRHKDAIVRALKKEEEKFRKTFQEGLRIINNHNEATGKILFDLYQSFGLPLEISIEEFKRKNIEVSNSAIEQYGNLLDEHRALSRTASAGMFKGGLAETGEMTTKYHTASHLLLAALQKVIDPTIIQRGSNITTERMRLDFNHSEKLTPEQIKRVENLVNEQIERDLPVTIEEMTLDKAKKSNAKGVFEHKYGERVKVYTIGDPVDPFSREICGGPHVDHIGKLGKFKIKKEESSSAGVRRIKAILN